MARLSNCKCTERLSPDQYSLDLIEYPVDGVYENADEGAFTSKVVLAVRQVCGHKFASTRGNTLFTSYYQTAFCASGGLGEQNQTREG